MTSDEVKEFVDNQLDNGINDAGIVGEICSPNKRDIYTICERLLQEQERRELQKDFRLALDYLGKPNNPIPETSYGLMVGSHSHPTE